MDYITSFAAAFIAISNPIGKLPFWQVICELEKSGVRIRLAIFHVLTATTILLSLFWLKDPLLTFFGLTLASFKIGGGLIIGITGRQMLQQGASDAMHLDDLEETQVSKRSLVRFRETVVPFVIPLMSGPGAMSTVMLYSSYAQNDSEKIAGSAVILGVMMTTALTLIFANKLCDILGKTLLLIITKLFGFILIVLAAQMVVEGLGEVFPNWINEHSPIYEEVERARANENEKVTHTEK